MVRVHVVLADDLVRAIDTVAGERGRSGFLEDAAREKLDRLALEAALRETSGVLAAHAHPEWDGRKRTAEWVRELRRSEPEV